jgi:hypothetical protein
MTNTASGTGGATLTEANSYHVHAHDLDIQYSATSLTGEPLMSVDQKGVKKSFRGSEITTTESPLGRLVTVTLEVVPDLRAVTLTLVVPMVNVGTHSEQVHTFAVIATGRSSIGGPRLVKGQVETYSTIQVSGTAQAVTP